MKGVGLEGSPSSWQWYEAYGLWSWTNLGSPTPRPLFCDLLTNCMLLLELLISFVSGLY